jgi:plasmid stabilization system protein ParE
VKVRWSQRAATQLFEAADYLEHERPGTGERFYAAVDRIVAILRDQPRAFARAHEETGADVRRALVIRYGYWLIYRIVGENVEVVMVAVWSTRRDPEGWRSGG